MSSAILIKSGGGGISSDEVTATKAQVLEGRTALTSDSGDEIATGTMLSDATITNTNQLLEGIVAYGRHGVRVGGTMLSDATITNNNQMLSGVVAYGRHGGRYVGNIPSMNGYTITPSTAQQTVSCAGYKMNSNIVVNPIPSNWTYIGDSGSTYQIMFNGTFADGWSFKDSLWDPYTQVYTRNTFTNAMTDSYGGDTYTGWYVADSAKNTQALVLNKSIDLTGISAIRCFWFMTYGSGRYSYWHMYLLNAESKLIVSDQEFKVMQDSSMTTYTDWQWHEYDVSQYSGRYFIGFGENPYSAYVGGIQLVKK